MGYTNYYYQHRDFTDTEWDIVKREKDYIKDLGFDIEILEDDKVLFLQGECETLVIRKHRRSKKRYEDDNLSFDCCKTRMAKYDLAVWYILCSCNALLGKDFQIERDR
mgnify:CR=1 FL=1